MAENETVVLTFEKFWQWLQQHPNCIVSAGTPDVLLYDHEDFHWHFSKDSPDVLLLQVLRGKELVGELLIAAGTVTYVKGESRGEEEYVFECIVESGEGPVPAYHFTLSHDYSTEEPERQGRWVH